MSAAAATGSHDPADIILDPERGPSEIDKRVVKRLREPISSINT
jgi:hypothetical protein